MKKYIFFTCGIQGIGGAQNYVRSKIKYLKADGWKVYVIHAGGGSDLCPFQELNAYIDGGIPAIGQNPAETYGSLEFYSALYQMLCYVEYNKNDECEYWIESHNDYDSIWAEILSEILHAKHLCLLIRENYFREGAHFKEYIKYFDFKFKRNELYGISDCSMHNLFKGYKDVEISDRYQFTAGICDNVEDIKCETIESLPERDYTIGYMGRCEKPYFSLIIDNVGEFADRHADKSILFLVMGSAREPELFKLEELEMHGNVEVKYLGVFNPIPKIFFDKVDVMIAGSGCAVISYMQDAITIVPHAIQLYPTGILGYTTEDALYGRVCGDYTDWLEMILVQKKYFNLPRRRIDHLYDSFGEGVYKNLAEKVAGTNFPEEYYAFNFSKHEEYGRNPVCFRGANAFLRLLEQKEEIRNMFYSHIKNLGYKHIGMYGYGQIGKRIREVLPGIHFDYIFDAKKADEENDVVYPNSELLKEIELIILSPAGLDDEIKADLMKYAFNGRTVSFYQCSFEFMKNLFHEKDFSIEI